MEVIARLKQAPLSAQKARLVVDLVRNMDVATAIHTLKYTPKKGAKIVLKLLESAVANAENNHGADLDQLVIGTIFADEAGTLKRVSPRAKGRANRISKRHTHITIKLRDEE